GVEAEKRGQGRRFRLVVAKGALPRAWSVLKRAGLPQPATLADPSTTLEALGPHEAARLHKAEALRALLRHWPEVVDASVVLGARGAAVSLTLREGASPPPLASLKAQVQAGADLKDSAEIVIVHHASGGAPLPEVTGVSLSQLSVGAGLAFAGACLLLWLRLRQVQGDPP
ncbi:hypothetical protein KKF91_18065, partial [Myxococcota bacterium]|nr:hypothetical protein [Myxococcota bacterium]